MCTPLVYQGLVYIVKYNGVLTVYDAKTGERKYQERLAGGTSAFTASPVAANGKVYFANEDGQVFVVKAGPTFEIVATNDMASPVLATPAISEGGCSSAPRPSCSRSAPARATATARRQRAARIAFS